jgi:hypothetical protein
MRDQVIGEEFIHFLYAIPDLLPRCIGEAVCHFEDLLDMRDQFLVLVT